MHFGTGAIAYTDDMMGSMEQTLAQGLDGLKEKYEEMLSTMNTTVETIRANRKELPKGRRCNHQCRTCRYGRRRAV